MKIEITIELDEEQIKLFKEDLRVIEERNNPTDEDVIDWIKAIASDAVEAQVDYLKDTYGQL